MFIAPLLAGQESIFTYLQQMNGIYFIPIFALVTVGIFARRVPPLAAKVALIVGIVVIAAGYFLPPFSDWAGRINEFHFLGAVFVCLVGLMLGIGYLRPMPARWVQEHSGDVDMTPWRWAVPTGVMLVIVVIAIYAAFADFSPAPAPDPPPVAPLEG